MTATATATLGQFVPIYTRVCDYPQPEAEIHIITGQIRPVSMPRCAQMNLY